MALFEQYKPKQKLWGLAVFTVLLLVTAYKRSFSGFFAVTAQHTELEHRVLDMQEKAKTFEILERENKELDLTLGANIRDRDAVQQGLVGFVAGYETVSISDLSAPHAYSDTHYDTVTHILDVTGSLQSLSRLAYDLEKNFGLSRMVAMEFYNAKTQNNKKQLHLKMIFQNYEKNR